MAKLHHVKLSEAERSALQAMTTKGSGKAQRLRRARTLLLADAGRADEPIAQALQIGRATVERTRRRYAEEGLEAALSRRAQVRPSKLPKLDGAAEAHLVALACGSPPEGRARWTLQLLADRLVELVEVEDGRVSYETVRRTLKKTRSSPGRSPSSGASRPRPARPS